MKRILALFAIPVSLIGCSKESIPDPREPLPYILPGNKTDIEVIARERYYYQYILPFSQRKSDGSYVKYEDIVTPYRYGEFSGCEIYFFTYSDPENQAGKVDVTPYEPAKTNHHGVDIEFVGHEGWPYVFRMNEYNPYRSDFSSDHHGKQFNGGDAGETYTEILEFKEALALGRFTDEDLVQIAKSAEAIRNDPSLWHWTNEE